MTMQRVCGRLSSYRGALLAPRLYTTSAVATELNTTDPKRKPLFDKILIANRGEIACRVMRTANKLGIKTVAVYSEADADSMHVKLADEAYLIGSAPASESYLRSPTIIKVAKECGAQAIHPGYGFLSENADFAEKLALENVQFIGPPPAAMRAMGSKSESKRIMQGAGVPVVPGYHGEQQDAEFLREQADKIGYPVLIKAVLGGGGKGMRIVERREDFGMMLESSRREALKSFGDDKVLVEKYLTKPRHVEVQVFADTHGNAVHLFERDCSVQRRHQKIIEEAPAPDLLPEIRQQLGEKAVAAAKAVKYVGAGTVEFIMDESQEFYFMEMNTRLQVEHPVTEMVTGTDLVQWQLEVAAGNPLPMLQHEIKCTGHAFEARIYAENPDTGFLPDTGRLIHLSTPQPSADVRVETGVMAGDAISVHYDPMIAKLVVRGEDRYAALRVLRKALSEYEVVGLHTNINFLARLAESPDFIAGKVETGFIDKHLDELFPRTTKPSSQAIAQAAIAYIIDSNTKAAHLNGEESLSPWAAIDSFRLNALGMQSVELLFDDQLYIVEVTVADRLVYTVRIKNDADQTVAVFNNVRPLWNPLPGGTIGGHLRMLLDTRLCASNVIFNHKDSSITVFDQGKVAVFKVPVPQFTDDGATGVEGSVKAPMSCRIVQVLIESGVDVEEGTPLVVLEAMKMEHVIKAPMAGKVAEIYYKIGDFVEEGKPLVKFDNQE
ncbi:methylcrotonyl-CoA carboxylase [Coemansia reversa NRRL 1564]|uniref:Methylcrotonyl-CoA carboxylase n=1 Tax=Coemansia reversa (strain ATCC 12441 / NRRL 1564) TaxID=763665 RepID=A0A2G5B6G4_COERN|nr:methylcrotonyl-CoA carboxylase [Coemansia reversa NRRL 1564]|eukprot:PIA14584.1 methylcrotonyl-CoA carboxylase [Coemansia reversa NRRL 1564]